MSFVKIAKETAFVALITGGLLGLLGLAAIISLFALIISFT